MADDPRWSAWPTMLLRPLFAFVFLLALSTLAFACQPLDIQGDMAPCACTKKAWAELDAQLKALPSIESPQQLSALIHTYLCRSGDRAVAALHRSMPKRIAASTWGTGDEETTVRRVSRTEVTPRAAEAWRAGISQASDRVVLSYAPNAYCVASAEFVFKPTGCLLVGVGDACD